MLDISIVTATYNRIETLKRVLKLYNEQTYDPKKFEVIVFDDVSDINPEKEIKKLKTKYKLRFFRAKEHSGQGMIRNKAIKLAKGKYILFTGDDMLPDKNLIEEHMKIHRENKNIAVLGNVRWHDEVRNYFMNYLEGIQFHYQNIKNKNDVKLHFYTSNISLEKKWFDNEEYSPEFSNYGLEDIELGYRLEKKGLRVIYNPQAIVSHLHSYTFEQFCNRMKNVGKSAVIFVKIHPELKNKYIPIFPLNKIYKLGSFILSKRLVYFINKKIYWYSNFVYCYLKGIEEGGKNVERSKGFSCFFNL
jgi:glycosyltransferase involved in cell wall biosynthesis